MNELRLGVAEARFADIVWENEPLCTKDMIKMCEKELNWKRTTTYTVLKRLCEKEIFKTENSVVVSLISRDEFYSVQSERFVEETFKGSLPAFIAAFTAHKKPSAEEIQEIRRLIDGIEER